MKYKFDYSKEKNLILKVTRGISFDDVIDAVEQGRELDNFKHLNRRKYPNQRVLVVEINNYVYAVPYVVDKKKGMAFLKTIYPSSRHTKKYLGRKQKI